MFEERLRRFFAPTADYSKIYVDKCITDQTVKHLERRSSIITISRTGEASTPLERIGKKLDAGQKNQHRLYSDLKAILKLNICGKRLSFYQDHLTACQREPFTERIFQIRPEVAFSTRYGCFETPLYGFLDSFENKSFLELCKLTASAGGKKNNQKVDAYHLYLAEGNECGYFLTVDYHLKSMPDDAIKTKIVTPSELVAIIEESTGKKVSDEEAANEEYRIRQGAEKEMFDKIEPLNGEIMIETEIAFRKTKNSGRGGSSKKSGKEFFDKDLNPALLAEPKVIWRLPWYIIFGTVAVIGRNSSNAFITDVVRELAKHFTFDQLQQKLIIEYRYDREMGIPFSYACWAGIRDCDIHIRQSKMPAETWPTKPYLAQRISSMT